ncbi:MAG: hypothetical protein A3F33_03655 [Candidatus Woykebacteria bacterium RIFCSPHIGHO2_12_FULL_43_10]|uniref:Polysaccharide biosynthesis protein C-terminal domain-containing protein n=2 Tax=Candidatus Woykeibacteriota TaxID=1817899 RepID=A0A1G1WVH0_9BACT|nr:MAG: hypothetical protein A2802_02630 [Candidatus Woykebacteria bacterium RIFCSPHIGHO2_01_FULL_43_29]OGY30095.1 MAG: hypothetical protein A3J50_03360 [Candidatus Woykebacteria bacterium RIFCSPHIGHO2_02_FULL_43_16b]OGY30227.1 MAG: hypothetical protein A3F33_03655 [Candidatus Woykebacteria bacterium RIFCSPHIGHO2_12_FULL_43_10]OGY31768.1 MAG: hypothetical protein A3A61_02095 [Candidatus Woykebacteria bacterium RIFCSPLOWO2_01_FULL_43_14]
MIKNKLVFSSLFLFSATFVGNIFNAAYNFIMARFLGPANYGDLMALISILYILTFPSTVLSNIVTKFSAIFIAHEDYKKLHYLSDFLTRKIIIFGLVVIVGFAIFTPFLAQNLKITHTWALFLVSVLATLVFLVTLNFGLLTGVLKFKSLAAASIAWPVIRLAFSVGLILLGFSVTGAIVGFVLATAITYILTLYPMRFLNYFKEKHISLNWAQVGGYSLPASLSILGLTLLTNTDILLVKAFFSSDEAGAYSAVSLLAKIILFLSLPIVNMIFPVITQAYEAKRNFSRIFLIALGLITVLSGGTLGFFLLFPEFSISLLFGKSYLGASLYVGRMSIFIFVYALVYLFITLWLSIGRLKFALVSVVGALVQAILIYLYHSDLNQVIDISVYTCLGLLFLNVVYYLYSFRGKFR